MKKKIIVIVVALLFIFSFSMDFIKEQLPNISDKKSFRILANPDNKDFMDELVKYGKKEHINVSVEYVDDLEAVDMLEEDNNYDAVWMSNSVWLYMLNNARVSNSKSISINPVVMGIKKSKAKELGFVDNEIKNKDILNAVSSGKLKYVMTSVTKTNTGLTAYLGFLNSLAGSPEILTSDMLNNNDLVKNLKSLFSGVERVSGSASFLEDMFVNSNDDSVAITAS